MLPDENQATATGSSQQQRAQKIGNDWISDMELGHWVTGSMGRLSRPGHQVIILTQCETRFFPVLEKMPVHLKCSNDKSHCPVSVVGLKSLDVSPCNELLLLPMNIKNSLA